MPRVVASDLVEAAPEIVFGLMSDPHRYPELADPTERMLDVPEAEFGKGYTYREYGGVGPFKDESEWTVTEFEPPVRQVHVGDDGTMRYVLQIDVEPVAGGCRFTQTLDIEPRGFVRVLSTVLWPIWMRRLAQAAMDKTVANTKRAAEAEQARRG